ncbi:hypothetical protein GGI06_001659 [Coemansia sp. S85]|nr:hypothetical protein GGI06_001659 [Coemansia sp. S85]
MVLDGMVNSSEGHGVLLRPLLSVCRNIRAAAILRFSKVLTIRLSSNPDEESELLSYWSIHFTRAKFPTHLFAQNLNFDLDIFDVFRGTALQELSRKPFAGITCPKVSTVTVAFTPMSRLPHMADILSSPQEIESNIRAFVRHIKGMAPLVKKVAMTLTASIVDIPLYSDELRGSLVRQIFQLAEDREYNVYYQPMSMALQPTGIREMIVSDKNGDDISELAMQLARRNASTLQFLGITFSRLKDISPLIKDSAGRPVQYPCLHKLRFANSPDLRISHYASFPGAVPFPVLRSLNITSEYFFGDETPFRGNAQTLERLDLDLNARAVSVLKAHRVFTPISHPRLGCVKLGQRGELTQTSFATDVEFLRFVLSVGATAPVREVYSMLGLRGLHSLVPVFGDHASIQVLGLPYSPLQLWDVLALIKALPLLSDLQTFFPSLGSLPAGVSEKQLPTYVRETCSPIGEHLRRWRIGTSGSSDMEVVAKCALLVALACPNLDYAAVPEMDRELLMAHMKEIITKDGFRQRAPRLRRLLFGGWRNTFTSVQKAKAIRAMARATAAQAE